MSDARNPTEEFETQQNEMAAHKEKYAEFFEMLENVRRRRETDTIMIHHPEVLGDNYKEIVLNLNLISEAGLKLMILPPNRRSNGTSH